MFRSAVILSLSFFLLIQTDAVLFFLQRLPRCGATLPQQSWERGEGGPLINIQPLSVSKLTQMAERLHF